MMRAECSFVPMLASEMQIEDFLQHFPGCSKLMRRNFPLADCSEVRRTHFFLLGDSFVTVTRIGLLKGHFVTKIELRMLKGSFVMIKVNFGTRTMMRRRESSVMRMFGMEKSFVLRRNSERRA